MIFFCPVLSSGQAARPVRQISELPILYIGNTVPDVSLHQLLNYKDTCANLSDFRGKWILLDFWSIYCKTCLNALPELGALQKEFADKIQILLIAHPAGKNFGMASMKQTFNNWEKLGLYTPGLPVATSGNERIISLFPHEFIPHYIWIDPNGRLAAITSYKLINRETVKALLINH